MSLRRPHRRRHLLPLLAGLLALAGPLAPPLRAAEQPLRVSFGSQQWSIPASALQGFVADGRIRDQRLLWLVSASGWPDADLRAALVKPYAVNLPRLARFLDSPAGLAFLQQQSRAYRPLVAPRTGGPDLRVVALRSAILAEAAGGTLSALGIVSRLPVPLVIDLAGEPLLRCSALPCDNPQQCTALMSWLVFLPACLQAASSSQPILSSP